MLRHVAVTEEAVRAKGIELARGKRQLAWVYRLRSGQTRGAQVAGEPRGVHLRPEAGVRQALRPLGARQNAARHGQARRRRAIELGVDPETAENSIFINSISFPDAVNLGPSTTTPGCSSKTPPLAAPSASRNAPAWTPRTSASATQSSDRQPSHGSTPTSSRPTSTPCTTLSRPTASKNFAGSWPSRTWSATAGAVLATLGTSSLPVSRAWPCWRRSASPLTLWPQTGSRPGTRGGVRGHQSRPSPASPCPGCQPEHQHPRSPLSSPLQ